MNQRGNLPMINSLSQPASQGKVARCHNAAIEDMSEVESTIRFVCFYILWILHSDSLGISHVVGDVNAVRPGIVGGKGKSRRQAMLYGSHHTIITSIGSSNNECRSLSPARIVRTRGGIGNR